MKRLIITGIAALITAASMTGCGIIDVFKETNTSETGVTSAAAEAAPAAETTTTAVSAAPDTSAQTTAAAGGETSGDNEFLNNLNKQMEYFNNYDPGDTTIDNNAGVSETPAVTTAAAAEPAAPAETAASAASDDGLVGMRIGDKDHGFITVPKSWCRFQSDSIDDPAMLQYCDGTENNIITMIKYDNYVAQQVADIVYDRLEADPDATITGSRSCEVEGKEAYRIDIEYKAENKYMYTWFIQDEGAAYYLAVEYTDPDVFELAKTYSTEK